MMAAAEAIYQLAARGHIMAGSEALSHTEAQNAWCKGQAAFIPCGSWLEGEQQAGHAGRVRHGDGHRARTHRLRQAARTGRLWRPAASRSWCPPRRRTPQGGLEFLRVLFSKQVARGFAESAKALPVVNGATDGLTLPSGLAQRRRGGESGRPERVQLPLPHLVRAAVQGASTTPPASCSPSGSTRQQWAERVQKAADAVAKDTSIVKHTR